MNGAASFRGQPLLLLGGVLFGWLGMRVAFWEPPLEPPVGAAGVVAVKSAPIRPISVDAREAGTSPAATMPDAALRPASRPRPARLYWPGKAVPAPLPPVVSFEVVPSARAVSAAQSLPVARRPARAVIGHNLLLAAGLAEMEIPPFLLAYLQQPPVRGIPAAAPALAALPARAPASPALRWSVDGWVMFRDDTITPIQAGLPTYGRSQAGAVVRYRLAPSSEWLPQAYLRASAAVTGPHEQELAAGVSARLLPSVPVRFAAETRVTDTGAGARVRPAAFAVTEIPPIRLPLSARGEVYVQGGYVGGEAATAFVDGQARVERTLFGSEGTRVSAGIGAWGGAQEGAARFDIGPAATLTFRVGGTQGRLAADYRIRVAGDAEPKSGPALTLSAGF